MCLTTTLGRIPAASWETISLPATNPWIINFDILLRGGGIISYLGLDTIFLSDLNLEMWTDRLGTWGGRRRRGILDRLLAQPESKCVGDAGHLLGRPTKLGGYGSSRKEDKLRT